MTQITVIYLGCGCVTTLPPAPGEPCRACGHSDPGILAREKRTLKEPAA